MTDYHKIPAYITLDTEGAMVSPSQLKAFSVSPQRYVWQYVMGNDVSSQAMAFGTMFHAMVLEPDLWKKDFAVLPNGHDGRTKEGKEFIKNNSGKTLVKNDDVQTMQIMAERVRDCQIIPDQPFTMGQALEKSLTEDPIFWVDQDTGLRCKTKPDCVLKFAVDDGHEYLLVDLKTTADASVEACEKSVFLDYAIQAGAQFAGLESQGKKPMGIVFLFVQKTAPYIAQSIFVPYNTVGGDFVRSRYKSALAQFHHGLVNGLPLDLKTIPTTAIPPEWILRKGDFV